MSTEQLPGLQMAVNLLAQIGDDESDRAIAAVHDLADEHAQRLTLQHHASDQAQRIAELERHAANLVSESEAKIPAMQAAFEERLTLDRANRLLVRRIADLETKCDTLKELHDAAAYERNTARGAVRELERQVFALQQQRDVLQTCLDRHQRDEVDPPGYLQDAVIRAAGLGALHTERDAAIKERDELRARLAEIEAQVQASYRNDYPIREQELGCEIKKALADEKLLGVGFLVNGWHVPARLVSAFRPAPAQAVPDADGARYRWLRSRPVEVPTNGPDLALWSDSCGDALRGDDADAAIDAAMAAAPEHKA